MTELLLMLAIPPAVGVLTFIAVRWLGNKDRRQPSALREPRIK